MAPHLDQSSSEYPRWRERQLAKAPDPSGDPQRCAKLARLLGLTAPAVSSCASSEEVPSYGESSD